MMIHNVTKELEIFYRKLNLNVTEIDTVMSQTTIINNVK